MRLIEVYNSLATPTLNDFEVHSEVKCNHSNQVKFSKTFKSYKPNDFSGELNAKVIAFESEFAKLEQALVNYRAKKDAKETLYSNVDESTKKKFKRDLSEHLAYHIVLKDHKLRY